MWKKSFIEITMWGKDEEKQKKEKKVDEDNFVAVENYETRIFT